MTIALQTVEQVAASEVARGFAPDYVASAYRSNAADMRDRAERIRRKGEGSMVAGYTLEMCVASIEMAEHRAVAVPAAMRELLLCREFDAYIAEQGLPDMDAEELIHTDLTAEQRSWVSNYISRWEAAGL